MEPKVVKICRQKGQIIQDCDVYIGRRCYMGGWQLPASKWANPFTLAKHGSHALALYREYLESRSDLIDALPELTGKTLGCWCKPNACHGDILVELYKSRVLVKI